MFNCWILVFLLLCCNNGSMCFGNCNSKRDCRRDCDDMKDRRRDCDRDDNTGCGRRETKDCTPVFTNQRSCDDDFVQSRPFSGFPSQNTCGCESKSE